MSYIDNNLLPDERIVFRTKKHLIIFFFPVICTLLAIPVYAYMRSNSVLIHVTFAPWAVVAVLWIHAELQYLFSDFAVTNKRVMLREGLFVRHTNELRLSAISQVNVEQNLFGQMIDYGSVAINSFGSFDRYDGISKPGKFQRAVNGQLDKVVR